MEIRKKFYRRIFRMGLTYFLVMASLLGLIAFAFYMSGEPMGEEIAFILPLLLGISLLPALILVIRWKSGNLTGKFDRYVNSLSETEKQAFYRECEKGYALASAVVTERCVIISEINMLSLIPIERIVWVYPFSQMVYFYSAQQLVIITDDKKRHLLNLGKKSKSLGLDEFIHRIREKKPGVFVGHDQIKDAMFRKEFDEMKRLAASGR